MTEYSGGRASIHIRCSPAFKEKITAYARAKGKCVSDVILDELAVAMQFFDYDQTAQTHSARADWEMMASETREGNPL